MSRTVGRGGVGWVRQVTGGNSTAGQEKFYSAAEQGEPAPGAWNCLEAAGSQDLPTVHRQHKGACDPSGFTSGGGGSEPAGVHLTTRGV